VTYDRLMRLVAVMQLLALAGCDRVLGLHTLAPMPDGAPDAPPLPFSVTGLYHQMYATNDSTGTPTVVDRYYATSEISMNVTLDDGTTPAVIYNADGTFSFGLETQGQSYRLRVVNDNGAVEYQLDLPEIELVTRAAGRPNRTPVMNPTTLSLSYGAAAGNFVVDSTGLWTHTGAGNVASLTFNYANATSQSGALGLLDATTENDRVFFDDFVGYPTTAPTYSAIGAYAVAKATLVNGGNAAVAGTLMPLAASSCAHIVGADGVDYNRLVAASLVPYTSATSDWYVFAVPSPTMTGTQGALPVAVEGYNPPVDLNVAPTFGNPFPGTQLLASEGVGGTRTVSPTGQTPFPIADGTRTFAPITGTCPAASTILEATLGLPGGPAIDGNALTSDGQVVTIDPRTPLALTWSLRAPGPVDYYTVTVSQVMSPGLVTLETIVTLQPSAVLDPALFIDGHDYMLGLGTHVGVPNFASGDTKTLTYPAQTASVWSVPLRAQVTSQ